VTTRPSDVYRELVESLDAIFWEAEPRALQFTSVSSKAATLLGYAQSDWTSNPTFWADIIHPEDRQQAIDTRVQAVKRCEDHRLEYRVMAVDGHTRWIRDSARVKCEPGQPTRVYGVMIDVTPPQERQPPAIDHRPLEEQLRQTQKMEAVGRLAGGIAHEFNNLLAVIIGYSELVLLQLAPGKQPYRDVEEIRRALASAAALTRQILAFNRKQILQRQILDMNEIVSRTTALLRRLIGEDIELVTLLSTAVDPVWADPGQLEQIILNLALNARDAMPRGGRLTLETANADLDALWIAGHPDASEGRHVMLTISDTGTGMDETVQAHLFEPFYTTKERGKGTGLGLATVYGIVKQSGGSIAVESEPELGTTFKIFLPRTERAADPADAPPPVPQSLTGTETILVVEDQPEVRAVIRDILARHGYGVLEAANSVEAQSILTSSDGEVHLLLTDLVLPGTSGRDLAEQLVVGRPNLRVLCMSGYTDDMVVHHGVLDAGIAFIRKPFTPKVLLKKIRDVLDG
jgi:PAS domain S-box-containing protein